MKHRSAFREVKETSVEGGHHGKSTYIHSAAPESTWKARRKIKNANLIDGEILSDEKKKKRI